jgi:molybdopterin synthase sulfur carrier subunit
VAEPPDAATNGGQPVRVRIRYFAAARAAAGVDSELVTLTGRATVRDALRAAVDHHGPALGRVLLRCSYLLGEIAVHGDESFVADGDVLDVLPPFAGG